MDFAVAEFQDGCGDGGQVLRPCADEEAHDFDLTSQVALCAGPARRAVEREKSAAGYGHVGPRLSTWPAFIAGRYPAGAVPLAVDLVAR